MRHFTLAVFASFTIACAATTRTSIEPFHPARLVDVQYTGAIGPEAGSEHSTTKRARAVPARESATDAQPFADAMRGPRASIHARFARIDRAFAARIASDGVAHGRVLGANDVERFERELASEIASGSVDLLSAPTLQLADAREGVLSTSDGLAFVHGFSLRSAGATSIVDPRVHDLEQGTSMRATPHLAADGEAIALHVAIETVQVMGPVESTVRALPGTRERIEIQIPITLRQTLETQATLARDEALVLGPIADASEDHALVVVIRAHRVAP